MNDGINFQYYKVDDTGKITRFSITGFKGMELTEFMNLKNSEVRQWALYFKRDIDQFFTLSLEEARKSSNYIKKRLV
jgi:hypothetical protein